MAYRAEIEIGIKGAARLKDLQNRLENLATLIDKNNNKPLFDRIAVQSVNEYSAALSTAKRNLDQVQIELNDAGKATGDYAKNIREFVTALGASNQAQKITNNLIDQEISARTQATAALKAYNAAAAAPTQRGAATTMAGSYMRGAFRGGAQYPGPIGPGAASSTALSSPLPARSARTTQYLSPIGPISPQARTGRAEGLAREAALKSKANQAEFAAQQTFQTKLFNIEKQFENSLIRQRVEADNAEFSRLLKRLDTEESKRNEINTLTEKANKKQVDDFDRRLKEKGTLRGQTSPIGGAANIPGSPAFKKRAAFNKKVSKKAADAALGVGFPLLMGGGPAQALAGGLGGVAGGLGGSILASAVVSQVQALFDSFGNLAAAMDDPIQLLNELSNMGFKVSNSTKSYAAALESQGRFAEAAKVANDELSKALGADGIEAAVAYKEAQDKLNESVAKLSVEILTVLGPAVNSFIGFVTDIVASLDGGAPGRLSKRDPEAFKEVRGEARRLTQASPFAFGDPEAYQKTLNKLSAERLAILDKENITTESIEAKQASIIEKTRLRNDLYAHQDKTFAKNNKFLERELAIENMILPAQKKQKEIAVADLEVDKQRLKLKKAEAALTQQGEKDFDGPKELELRAAVNSEDADLRRLETKADVVRLVQKQVEQEKEALAAIQAQSLLENGRIDLAQKRMGMESSIASARSSALLAVNSLEMQRATNAGDTAKQLQLQVQRANLIYNQTVLQVKQDQKKAQLAALAAQIKLKELQANVQLRQAKGEANAADFAAIELQKQALQLTLEGVNASAQIAQFNLQTAGAIRQATVEQSKFNATAARAGGGGGGGGGGLGGGGGSGGATVYGGGTRSIGSATTGSLARALSAAGVTGKFSEAQASGILASKRQARVDAFQAATKGTLNYTSMPSNRELERAGFAEGGYVTRPTNALIGEGGESEYVIPSSKMNSAMQRYSSGVRGEAVTAGAVAAGSTTNANYSSEQNMYYGGGAASVNITTGPVIRMGNNDYVSMSDLQRGMATAANAGQANMMRSMRRSYGARRSMGA